MAIITTHPDITTEASKIVDVDNVTRYVRLHAHQGGVYIGNSGVTSEIGFLLDSDDKIDLDLQEGEDLWAVTASGTKDLYVLVSKID
jgi:hypothetical protein